MNESQWLAEKNSLLAQIDALEAARLQYRVSMERFQRLGRACLHWQAGGWSHELDAAINEWKAGEPKNSEEFSVWLSRIVWYAHTLGPYGWARWEEVKP